VQVRIREAERQPRNLNHALGVVEFTFSVSVGDALDADHAAGTSGDVSVAGNAVVGENLLGEFVRGARDHLEEIA
jgi:hypothetical protein